MFKQIELVIGMFVAEGERPPATSEELSPWLQEQHGRLEVVRDKKTGAVVDRWGTPIRLIVKSPTDYTLVSLGPNREDDGCAEDDILHSFNPRQWQTRDSGVQ